MPKLSLYPGNAGDEAVGVNGAKDRACFRIYLVDFPVSILADPERSFGPRESRITTSAGGWNGCEHAAGGGINLMDTVFGNLKQVFAVECSPGMSGDVDGTLNLSAFGVKSVQLVSRGKPNILSVPSDTIDSFGARKRTVLTN